MPVNKSVLFPVIDYEANMFDDSEFRTNEELIAAVKRDIDGISMIY